METSNADTVVHRKADLLEVRKVSHLSRVVQDLERSVRFHCEVMGFQEIKRPESLQCEGAWLWGYGIALHLIAGHANRVPRELDPEDDHTSFTVDAADMPVVRERLAAKGIKFIEAHVEEGGMLVTQIFFHCPDNHMIEVCNCDCLPIEILREKSCEMLQDLRTKSCQLQHQKQPRRSLSGSVGSMDLSDMHFSAPIARPVPSGAA